MSITANKKIISYCGDRFSDHVISRGIPYLALELVFEKKCYEEILIRVRAKFGKYGVLAFILVLILLAYIAEGLWDDFL